MLAKLSIALDGGTCSHWDFCPDQYIHQKQWYTLVTLRDYNGEAKLSDELQELKDLITLTQGGAWFIILLNFIAIVMSVTTVVLIAINKYPTPFTTVVSLDFIKLNDWQAITNHVTSTDHYFHRSLDTVHFGHWSGIHCVCHILGRGPRALWGGRQALKYWRRGHLWQCCPHNHQLYPGRECITLVIYGHQSN